MGSPQIDITKKNIVHVFHHFDVGGVESWLVNTLPKLPPERYNVRLVCTGKVGPYADELRKAGIAVDEIPVPTRFNLPGLMKLRSYLKQLRPHILHSHMFINNATATAVARMFVPRIPVVCHAHLSYEWNKKSRTRLDSFLDRWRSHYLHVSQDTKQAMQRALPQIPEEKMSVMLNCARSLPPPAEREATRRELDIPEGSFIIGTVARFAPEKSLDVLIQAFAQVSETHPQTRLVLVGEGATFDACKALATELGVHDRVIFTGVQSRVQDYFNLFDLFCLTSSAEACPIALIESLQFGVPSVASNVGGIPEVVRHQRETLLVPPNNPQLLAQAITRLINDKQLLKTLADNSAARSQDFNRERYIQNLCQLYDSL